MSDDAMTNPCTRRDLIEVLADHPTKQDLQTLLAHHSTKQDLETWGGALREEFRANLDRFRREVREILAEVHRSLVDELRRHSLANTEELTTRVRAVDDQYRELPARIRNLDEQNLPARVTRLEAKVFKPRRAAKRTTTPRRRSR